MDLSWHEVAPRSPQGQSHVNVACRRLPRRATAAPARRRGAALKAQLKRERQTFHRLLTRWRRRRRLDPAQPRLGWLQIRGLSGCEWAVGCTICASAGCATAWAKFLVKPRGLSQVLRHAKASQHLAATSRLSPPSTRPSCADFVQVLEERAQGQSYNSSTIVGSREKNLRLSWCLAEAIRDSDRSFLRRSSVMAIHQDSRTEDGLLLVRFVAVDSNLDCRAGVLGVARGHGTTAEEVAKATMDILRSACTPRLGPPRQPAAAGDLDVELVERVKSSVEIFIADGAAEEQLAGRLLKAHLPNLRIQVRDKTHAATRPAPACLLAVAELAGLPACLLAVAELFKSSASPVPSH